MVATTARANLIAECKTDLAIQAAIVLVPIEARLAEYKLLRTQVQLTSTQPAPLLTAQVSTHKTSRLDRFGKVYDIHKAQAKSVASKRTKREVVKQAIVKLLQDVKLSIRKLTARLKTLGHEVSRGSVTSYVTQLREAGRLPVLAT